MSKKTMIIGLVLVFIFGISTLGFAATVTLIKIVDTPNSQVV